MEATQSDMFGNTEQTERQQHKGGLSLGLQPSGQHVPEVPQQSSAWTATTGSPFVATPLQPCEPSPSNGSSQSPVERDYRDGCHVDGRATTTASSPYPPSAADISAVSAELEFVTLEENNERLRSALAAERRARQLAEAELAVQTARAREFEQRACEALAKLAQAEQLLSTSGTTAGGGVSGLGACLDSSQAEVTAASDAVAVPAGSLAAAHHHHHHHLHSRQPQSASIAATAAPSLHTPQPSQGRSCPFTASGPLEASSWLSPRDCTVDDSPSVLAAGTLDTRSGEVSLGTCVHASDLDLSVGSEDPQFDDSQAGVPPTSEDLDYALPWRRTDGGATAHHPVDLVAAEASVFLQRAQTASAALTTNDYWSCLDHYQLDPHSLQQQRQEQEPPRSEQQRRRSLLLMSTPLSSRFLAAGPEAADRPQPNTPFGYQEAMTAYGPVVVDPSETRAMGSPLAHASAHILPFTAAVVGSRLSPNPQQQSYGGMRAKLLTTSSLRHLVITSGGGGAVPHKGGEGAGALTDDAPVEWSTIPLGSPACTPTKAPRRAEV